MQSEFAEIVNLFLKENNAKTRSGKLISTHRHTCLFLIRKQEEGHKRDS